MSQKFTSKLRKENDFEEIVAALRKNNGNGVCAECGERNPQYVCTTFNIFVCNICSGIHREFQHRIKSISVSKFTKKEVETLISGGNKKSNELFLYRFTTKSFVPPRPGDIERIRCWIRMKYFEKNWMKVDAEDVSKPNRFFKKKTSTKKPKDDDSLNLTELSRIPPAEIPTEKDELLDLNDITQSFNNEPENFLSQNNDDYTAGKEIEEKKTKKTKREEKNETGEDWEEDWADFEEANRRNFFDEIPAESDGIGENNAITAGLGQNSSAFVEADPFEELMQKNRMLKNKKSETIKGENKQKTDLNELEESLLNFDLH